MEYKELEQKVIEWAEEKGISEKSTPIKQIGKTQEELLETYAALHDLAQCKSKMNEIKRSEALAETEDGIGDMLVTIIILANMVGLDTVKCLNTAYNVIRDRQGKMVNGLFVKDK